MNGIPSGKLIHTVQIVEPLVSKNDLGEEIASGYKTLGTCKACITPLAGRQLERARGTVETVTHEILLRYTPLVTLRRLIQFHNRYFVVNQVINQDERNLNLKLVCTELIS